MDVIGALIDVADTGGVLANTFLAHRGVLMGKTHVESNHDGAIDSIYEHIAQKVGCQRTDAFLVLPVDMAVGASTVQTVTYKNVPICDIPPSVMALDVGSETAKLIESIVLPAQTVIWNGPLGLAEVPAFATVSTVLARTLACHTDTITLIVGGGDTASFVIHWDAKCSSNLYHILMGGGVSHYLAWLLY